MKRKLEIKKVPETQIIKELSDIESPLHGLSKSQVVKTAIHFDISLPFQYIEGEKCLDCLLVYAKKFEIEGRNFNVVPSKSALRIYAE